MVVTYIHPLFLKQNHEQKALHSRIDNWTSLWSNGINPILRILCTMSKFKISGQERRNLKKILHEYMAYEKGFWHYHQLDKDMAAMTGSWSRGDYPMSDEEAQKRYDKIVGKINELKTQLSETE